MRLAAGAAALVSAAAIAAWCAAPPASLAQDGAASGGAPAAPRVRPGDGVLAITGGEVHTVAEGTLRRGTVLVRDGKIWKVGTDLEVPEGARRLDATGRKVFPGLVAPSGEGIGLAAGQPRPGNLYRDSVDPYARSSELALSAGITAFHAATPPERGIWSSQTAVLRPALGDASLMVLREPASVVVRWSDAALADRAAFEDMLRSGAAHLREADAALRGGRTPPRQPVPADILAALRREIPVRVPASRQDDIRAALRLASDHGVRLVLEGCLEAWALPDAISRAGAVAVVTPRWKVMPDPRADGPSGGNIGVAGILERAGAAFVLLPVGGFTQPGHGVRLGGLAGRDLLHYPVEGAYAVRGGASEAAVLRALTLGAAEALGVADRVGSLSPGKDADIVLFDGDPLHYLSRAETVLVGGKVVYERSKSSFFRDPGTEASPVR
jgi:hypothetical protein